MSHSVKTVSWHSILILSPKAAAVSCLGKNWNYDLIPLQACPASCLPRLKMKQRKGSWDSPSLAHASLVVRMNAQVKCKSWRKTSSEAHSVLLQSWDYKWPGKFKSMNRYRSVKTGIRIWNGIILWIHPAKDSSKSCLCFLQYHEIYHFDMPSLQPSVLWHP